ncbi:hypothetical protein M758_1G247600 [Ceratodon purpureus]|nr:hypothetical protein M758_1G247600 [Ceratodon purpureus]
MGLVQRPTVCKSRRFQIQARTCRSDMNSVTQTMEYFYQTLSVCSSLGARSFTVCGGGRRECATSERNTGGRSKTSTRRPTNDDEEIRSDLTPGSTAGAANLGMGPSTHVKQ